MRVLIVAEGPSDREILKAILNKVKNNVELIDESKTQMKRRGKQSILFQYHILAKFLHHGFSSSAEIIIICVDNDNDVLDKSGIGSKKKDNLKNLIDRFIIENKNNAKYESIKPRWVLAVPVQTIDYWMKSIDEKDDDCQKIRQIESIDKSIIKIETYGKSNVYGGWVINREAINLKIQKIKNEAVALDKMRCLPGFKDFEDQLK